jgi:diacylglycerol kinase (ATP)
MLPTHNPHKGRTGLNRVVHAAGFSWDGLRSAYVHESAFRQECWLAFVLVPIAFWVGTTWIEVALLAGSAMLVLVAELLNSAVEATVDRVSLELHALAKQAKDYGSAAVLLSLVLCGSIWVAALWQRFAHST